MAAARESQPLREFGRGSTGSIDIDEEEEEDEPALKLGIRTIGKFGSFALIVNNISGPGMLDFPAAFQSGGYILGVSTIVVVASLSALIASMLCDVVAGLEEEDEDLRKLRSPHRQPLDPTVRGSLEFSGIFQKVFGQTGFVSTQWLYFLTLFSQNVGAIVATAQATDMLISTLFGSSVGLRLFTTQLEWWSAETECEHQAYKCQPFVYQQERKGPLLTLGYVSCAVLIGPLGFLNLEENMIAQKLSFGLLLMLCVQFLSVFWGQRNVGSVPAVGNQMSDVLGVVLFNFAFCVTVPAWVNEMKRDVDTRKVIWGSCLGSAALYIAVGWLGGRAYEMASDNVLSELTSPAASMTTRVAGGFFAFAIIGLGIPIFSVIMRYNLVAGRVCSELMASLICAGMPWALSWLVYQGDGIGVLFTWSGLVLNSLVDFVFPTLAVLKRRALHAADASLNKHARGHRPDELRPLVVRPLPWRCMPHYGKIATAIVYFVVFIISSNVVLKIAIAVTEGTAQP